MNGGTKRGRADGFKINALLKLESTKLQKVIEEEEEKIEETALGMNTMLDLISHQCWKADEHIKDRLLSELSCLKKASKIDLKDVQAKVKKLSSDIVRLDGNYKRVVETTKDIDVRGNRENTNGTTVSTDSRRKYALTICSVYFIMYRIHSTTKYQIFYPMLRKNPPC